MLCNSAILQIEASNGYSKLPCLADKDRDLSHYSDGSSLLFENASSPNWRVWEFLRELISS